MKEKRVKKKVLIAEAREVILAGLRAIFEEGIEVSEATTYKELQRLLMSRSFDLVIVHQSLLTDIRLLPQGKFVLLVDEPDVTLLMQAYKHQMRGFFSVNVPADLLKATLYMTPQTFSIDPVLLPWMLDTLLDSQEHSDELRLLSPREQEITSLLSNGLDRHTIAQELHIAESTLKTHMKNIARKKEKSQWSQRMLTHQRHIK
jgi:DNA-binding NarL/FixJ family response regulator